MSFFEFLDNKFRIFSLDAQKEFDLAKDGYQQACHAWVLTLRRIHKYQYYLMLPFLYILYKLGVVSQPSYTERMDEWKIMAAKKIAEAQAAQAAGAPLPIAQDPATVALNTIVTPIVTSSGSTNGKTNS